MRKLSAGCLGLLLLVLPWSLPGDLATTEQYENSYEGLLQIFSQLKLVETQLRSISVRRLRTMSQQESSLRQRLETIRDLESQLQNLSEQIETLRQSEMRLAARLNETDSSLRNSERELRRANQAITDLEHLLTKVRESLKRAKRQIVVSGVVSGVVGVGAGLLVGLLIK